MPTAGKRYVWLLFCNSRSTWRTSVKCYAGQSELCPAAPVSTKIRTIWTHLQYISKPNLSVTLTPTLLMWRIGWADSIPIYIQQDAGLHSLFISGNCSTYFGWYFHPSSGVNTTVSTASGICHTVTAICRYRGRVGTGLSVLCVAYATHNFVTLHLVGYILKYTYDARIYKR
jgi:hypothetical protein